MRYKQILPILLTLLALSMATTAVSAKLDTPPQNAPPVITWASDPVRPDDTVVLSGGNFTADMVVELSCLEQSAHVACPQEQSKQREVVRTITNWTTVKPLQIDENSAKFIVPSSDKVGVFVCRLAAGDLKSNAVLINAPDVWWMQGDCGSASSPGGWLRVFGKSLNFGGVSQACLKADDGRCIDLKASAADCYSLTFSIPQPISDGLYTVYIDNGLGGESAWKKAGQIRIEKTKQWPPAIYNVKELGLEAALAKAKANHGGVIYFPRGQYEMKGQIVLPPRTILRGQSMALATIYWPSMTNPPASLITGTSFGVEDIAIDVKGYHKNVIEDSPKSAGVRITKVLVRANAFYHLMDMGDLVKQWRGKKILHGAPENGCVIRMQGRNFQITDCDILATNKAIELWNAHNGLIARNKLRYGISGLAMEAVAGVIVEDNKVIGGNLAATGNNFSTYFSPSAQNVYVADNQFAQEYGYDSEAFTFDGAGGAYWGKLAQINGTHMVLAKDPTLRSYRPVYDNWAGAAFCIIDGKGVGQYRRVTHNQGRNWDIDRPWDIAPDSDSIISIVPFRGRVLFIGNRLEDAGVVQAYGTSLDCIFADNRFTRADGITLIGRNPHGWGWQPCWFCQVLDNHIITGNRWGKENGVLDVCALNRDQADVESGGSGKWLEFWGPLTRCAILRRNILDNNASIEVNGTVGDSVVENSIIRDTDTGIKVGKGPKDLLLRKNTFQNVDRPSVGKGLPEAQILSR